MVVRSLETGKVYEKIWMGMTYVKGSNVDQAKNYENLSKERLHSEFLSWIRNYGNGRNYNDLRFGQYLTIKYGDLTPGVFSIEEAQKVYDSLICYMINHESQSKTTIAWQLHELNMKYMSLYGQDEHIWRMFTELICAISKNKNEESRYYTD